MDRHQGHLCRFRGALWLKIENSHFGEVYVYGFGLVWDDGTSTRRNCSVHVPAGGASSLGLLIFEAPDSPGNHSYHIVISMASTERSFNPFLGWDVTWGDHGEVSMSDSNSAQVLPLLDTTAPKVTDNVPAYYTRINSLVSYEAAREVADIVRAEWPGSTTSCRWWKRSSGYAAPSSTGKRRQGSTTGRAPRRR